MVDALHRISPAVRVGERLVVRCRLADDSATDALGWVVSLDEHEVVLTDHRGDEVRIDRTRVVAARRLPVARGGRNPMRTTAAELELVALPGWAADREPLGEWTLRAAGGFTARANSCLAVGDPGMPVTQAAERVVAYAGLHAAYPWAQVVAGSDEEGQLRHLGWRDVYAAADVLVARLGEWLQRHEPHEQVKVEQVKVEENLHPSWEQAFRVSRPSSADPAWLRRILENGAPRGYASVTQRDEVVAIGRGHVAGDWLGLASIWTAPERRRQGLAEQVVVGLGHWGARRGARNAYLQVAADDEAAHRAYERLGFRPHHSYLYLAAPDG